MAIYHFIRAEMFPQLLVQVLEARSEKDLVLKWDSDRTNIYAEGYDLELCGVEVERQSPDGISFRTVIAEESFRDRILVPLSGRLPLQGDAKLDAVQAKVGEINERGLPTGQEICLWYGS